MLRPLLVSFLSLAALTGLAYPFAFTGLAQRLFPRQARGSLLMVDGQVRGSSLVGQTTEDPYFFWSRPSATAGFATNAGASGGSNLAPSSPALEEAVKKRIALLRASDPTQTAPIPQDLVTASASGLDPHISLEGARWQAPRIARLRGMRMEDLEHSMALCATRTPTGTTVVNVLALNARLGRRP